MKSVSFAVYGLAYECVLVQHIMFVLLTLIIPILFFFLLNNMCFMLVFCLHRTIQDLFIFLSLNF